MYWIIPGTIMLSMVKWKMMLQSHFDSIQVVNVTLPMAFLEWHAVTKGIVWLKWFWYIDWRALIAHLDRTGCHFGQVVACALNSETVIPVNTWWEWSVVMELYFYTTSISSYCLSSDLKLGEAQNVSSMVTSSLPKYAHELMIQYCYY